MVQGSLARLLQHSLWVLGLTLNAQTSPDLTSAALRLHANLPRYFRGGPSVDELLSEARAGAASKGIPWKGLDFIVSDADRVSGFTDTGVQRIYRGLSCSADTITVGHVAASAAHLSTSGIVYTDYIFVIDNLLLANQYLTNQSPAPIREVIVTRPGGALLVDGDPVSYQFEGSPSLKAGESYLQFLSFIPQSSAYQALNAFATLRKSGNAWILVRATTAPAVPGITSDNFEQTIRSWRNSCR